MLCLLDTLTVKEQKKTYVGAAVFFERLADDGWPEDAGMWPFDGLNSPRTKGPSERGQKARRLSLALLVKSFVRSSRMWRRVAITEE